MRANVSPRSGDSSRQAALFVLDMRRGDTISGMCEFSRLTDIGDADADAGRGREPLR